MLRLRRVSQTTGHDVASEDAELILRWRLEILRRAGYDDHSSLTLALEPGVDIHQATRLLDLGCPVQTALRILL